MKKIILSIALLISLLGGPASSATDKQLLNRLVDLRPGAPSLEINLHLEKKDKNYRTGEPIRISFSVSRDCYLTLFNIATDDSVTVLFPNHKIPDNFVQSGKKYRLWEESFEMRVQGAPGNEYIKAIATYFPTNLVDLEGLNAPFIVLEDENDWGELIRTLPQKLSDKKWAEKTAKLIIIPAETDIPVHRKTENQETDLKKSEFKVW